MHRTPLHHKIGPPAFPQLIDPSTFIIMKLIEQNMDALIALCRKYRVAKLWVFGSILTPRFNDDSDIDFAMIFDDEGVNSDPRDIATLFFDFIDALRTLFNREIDMVCYDAVKNPIFRSELDSTKQLIYG